MWERPQPRDISQSLRVGDTEIPPTLKPESAAPIHSLFSIGAPTLIAPLRPRTVVIADIV